MPFSPEDIERKHFLPALRGYDREQVDAFLRAVADEYRTVLRELELAREDGTRARSTDDELGLVGEHVERILRVAAQSAQEIRAASEEEAATLRAEAQRQLEAGRQVMADATGESDRAASEAVKTALRREEAERLWEEAAATEADAVRLREEAQRLRENAEQEAAQLRRTAEAYVGKLREEAQRFREEAAQVLEAAEREAAGLRKEAERARQESVRTLQAAEEELIVALELRSEAEQRITADPVGVPTEALPVSEATSGAAEGHETMTTDLGH